MQQNNGQDRYLKDKTKPRQKRELKGDNNQCPSCGEFFKSTYAFSKHLTGKVATAERRCMTVQEMLDSGMVKNAKDFWIGSAMPDSVLESIASEEQV